MVSVYKSAVCKRKLQLNSWILYILGQQGVRIRTAKIQFQDSTVLSMF